MPPEAPVSRTTRPEKTESVMAGAPTPAMTDGKAELPAALGVPLLGGQLRDVDAHHGLAEAARDLRDDVGVVEERRRLDDRLGPLGGVAGLEDARADEDALGPE